MWDSVAFRLRALAQDGWIRLGSWRLSVVLMVVAGLYHVLLAIWARSSSPVVVRSIAGLLPFWLVYGLLLVNTALCMWRRLDALRRAIAPGPALAGSGPGSSQPSPPATADEAASGLRRLGYRVTVREDGAVFGLRGRYAALGSYLFHGALFLLAAGWLLTLAARQEMRVRVAVGEEFEGREDQVVAVTAPRFASAGLLPLRFRLAEVRPELWGDQMLFTRLEADVEAEGHLATTRINRPLVLGPATYLRLAGFGYAPRWELSDGAGRVLDSAVVKLQVFPPGQRDAFVLGPLPHRVHLEVYPDAEIREGEVIGRSAALVDPALRVRVQRGRLGVSAGLLRLGEALEMEGLRLSFPEIRYWAEVSIVRDPGAPVVFVGFVTALAGLLLKIGGRRREAEWRPGPDGATWRTWGGASLAPAAQEAEP